MSESGRGQGSIGRAGRFHQRPVGVLLICLLPPGSLESACPDCLDTMLPPRAQKTVIQLIRIGILLILLVTTGLLYWVTARVLRGFASVVAGETTCSFAQIIEGERYCRRKQRFADELVKQVRLVEDASGLHHWQTRQGSFWTPNRMNKPSLVALLAEQESELYGTGFVKPGEVVLDCGANIGAFTRAALSAGARLVVAIDPAPDVVRSLEHTFAEEIRLGRVIVYAKGVWDKDDFLILKESHNSTMDSFVVDFRFRRPSAQRLPLTTIDKLVAELALPGIDVIKMDIEGAERRAIRGAEATIRSVRPRLMIAADHLPDDPVVLPELIRRLWPGYSMECGPCYQMTYHHGISPDVLYFR